MTRRIGQPSPGRGRVPCDRCSGPEHHEPANRDVTLIDGVSAQSQETVDPDHEHGTASLPTLEKYAATGS